MGSNDKLDEHFLAQAAESGLLSHDQVGNIRSELRRRREAEPELCAHEIAVEQGIIGVEAALALLGAQADDTMDQVRARAGGSHRPGSAPSLAPATDDHSDNAPISDGSVPALVPTEANPDDRFEQVPKLVEEMPDKEKIKTAAEDSVLEMELPPPDRKSGDSIFEDQQSKSAPSLAGGATEKPLTPEPQVVSERTPSVFFTGDLSPQTESASDTLSEMPTDGISIPMGSETVIEPPLGLPGDLKAPQRTGADTFTSEDELEHAPPPDFPVRGTKGATEDFASFGDDDAQEPESISVSMTDSAVGEVLEQADDGYFGPPADLTVTPQSLADESVAVIKEADGSTLFDSENLLAGQPPRTESSEFIATAPPESQEDAEAAALSEVTDDSDADVLITISDTGDLISAVESDVLTQEVTGEPPGAHITTGNRTMMATGEVARPGLGETGSKVGVESDITGSEMTLADFRAKVGIGAGVKLDGEGSPTMKRLTGGRGQLKKRYSVIREIARGGMGKVIEVEDTDLRRSVALKVLRKEMLGRADLVERFLEEAQITGQLEHPNIVPVHEIGVDGRGNLYFTMKLVEGEELSSVIKRLKAADPSARAAYPIGRLVDIFIKVCEGVAFAHSKGVIHRDLKPANIMVGRFGEVQIMDWGVAKIVGRLEETADRAVRSDRQDDDAAATMAGSILGTPSYMSPEQACGETDIGPASDIFSLGVILYELICLRTPWTGQTSAAVLDEVREVQPDPPSKRFPDQRIPLELEALAMKCLEKSTSRRIGSATELIDNLHSYQEGRTLAAVEYSLSQLIVKWLARHKIGVIATVAVLAALIGGMFVTQRYFRQKELDKIPGLMLDAKVAQGRYQEAIITSDFALAQTSATEAMSLYKRVVEIDETNEEASREASFMLVASQSVKEDRKRFEAEREKRQLRKRDQKQLDDLLEEARSNVDIADKLSNNENAEIETKREAYEEARGSCRIAKGFQEDHPELKSDAQLVATLARVVIWLSRVDEMAKHSAALAKLARLVVAARAKLKDAEAVVAKVSDSEETRARKYDEAGTRLWDTINAANQAIATSVSGERAEELRAEAALLKADAALSFARRALLRGKYGESNMMLKIAASTNQRKAENKALRSTLSKKIAEQSKYATLLKNARKAVNNREWTLAQELIQNALKEAQTSSFATDDDRTRLGRWLQMARLEEIRRDEGSARSSEALGRILAKYDLLIPELNDRDYRNQAEGFREAVKTRLGRALVSEAEEKPDAVAAQLYQSALQYLTDKGQIAEVRTKLSEIRLRLALAELSENYALLPRGTFVIGSNREGDTNPQRLFDQTAILFVDKHPVTNGEYREFVQAGGYERDEYWDDEATALLDTFVDSTGKPGPKDWVEGGFDESLLHFPVTGVSWYEARAYARWAGKRLPTPEEWEIAAGAPLATNPEIVGAYSFGGRENAPAGGVAEMREVGTTEWDKHPTGVRDLGCNVAEWTDSRQEPGRAVVKGAEPGMKPELFFRYARRAKNSLSKLAERAEGRGFRCVREFSLEKKDNGNG